MKKYNKLSLMDSSLLKRITNCSLIFIFPKPYILNFIIFILLSLFFNLFIMFSLVKSIAVNWLSWTIIDVEVDINNWLASFTIVWLPDQWVQESKERIRSALKSSFAKLPTTRITVNLAPADIRKVWPSFDLPIAIGILLSDEIILEKKLVDESIFLWELALDWKLRKVSWVLPATISARENWFKRIFVPKENIKEASIVDWIDIIWIDSLLDLIDILNLRKDYEVSPKIDLSSLKQEKLEKYDFSYVIWQEFAKRALMISASWWHNIIMNWPPWSWKTMLAKALRTILPDLTIEESIEISKIYSISGLLSAENPVIVDRPFRTVHHTASSISIIGWWRNAKPWEISLAHKWVLFFDEVLEFQKNVLEVLRQPLEDWNITVNRVNSTYTYPAKFMFVGAMNPCPCGFLTDLKKECKCSAKEIERYRSRLSGPLLDRIDIFIEVPKVETDKFGKNAPKWESSIDIKKKVEKARQIQLDRFAESKITFNAEMWAKEVEKYCKLDNDWEVILKQAVNNLDLSARSYYKILKLSRTIADLAWSQDITTTHLLEALSFRKKGG